MGLLEYLGIRSGPEIYYYNVRQEFCPEILAEKLEEMIREELKKGKQGVVFLCIGTDRSTGDSLGPLIGHKLKEQERQWGFKRRAAVFGTLERPVHAMNLEKYQEFVYRNFPNYVVVAVDASVGDSEHIGFVTLGKGSLKPGLGVSKDLDEVGDLFITGIVGGSGEFDPVMLQSVRLSMVMRMADCICQSISLVENLWDFPSAV